MAKERIKELILCIFNKGTWFPITIFVLYLILIFGINIYSIFPNFDIIMHFTGGIAIAYFFIYLVKYLMDHGFLGKPSFFNIVLLIFLLTCSATVFWEFSEWIIDTILNIKTQVDASDTILDMFLGILGGSLITIIMVKKVFKKY